MYNVRDTRLTFFALRRAILSLSASYSPDCVSKMMAVIKNANISSLPFHLGS